MAGRLRHGAESGYYDIYNNPIHVGERVKDSAGETWYINSWLQAVPDGEGKAIPIRTLRTTLCELCADKTESDLTESVKTQPVKESEEEAKAEEKQPRRVLDLYTDKELADELRRRGFELSASKTITVTL